MSWILINLSNYSQQVVDILSSKYENLEYVKDFFRYSDEFLYSNSLWLIGNMCADVHNNRVFFVKSGIIEQMAFMLNEFVTSSEIKEKIVWTLCNMSRGKMSGIINEFIPVAESLIKYLCNTNEDKELSQALFLLFKLTSTVGVVFNQYVNPQTFKRITELLNKCSYKNKIYIVKVVANLVSGNDVQTQLLINEGIIEVYKGLMQEEDIKIIKEVIWGISNIAGGTVSQIEKLIKIGLLKSVLEISEYLIGKYEDSEFFVVNIFINLDS